MAELKPEVLAALQGIRDTFARELPARLAELRAAWEEGDEAGRLRATQAQAHRLAGSGGTLGFPIMGAVARELERHLQELQKQGLPLDATLRAEIDARIQAVGFAAEQDRAGGARDSTAPREAPVHGSEEGPLRLLVPDPGLAKDLSAQFQGFGFRVQVHGSPEALLEALREEPTVLAVVDTDRPGDGELDLAPFEAFQKARDRPVPMIVLSESTGLDHRLRAVRAGAQAFLSKPVDLFGLLDKLDELNLTHRQEPLNILIVEDDALLAQQHALALNQAGMDTTVVSDPMAVMRPLVDLRPDLILMDLHMPGCNGLELAAVIRQQDAFVGIPLVFLSGEAERERQLAAMRLGADDFLTKPVPQAHLVSIVASRALRGRRLRSFMVRDSLTGLLNHSAIKEQLVRELGRAEREEEPLAFAMVDLDHFKRVNDTHGHPGGDRVIRGLARMLQQRLRKTDIIGRYGGEEFAAILPNTTLEQAARIFESLSHAFAALRFPFDREPRHVTLSCGLAAFPAVYGPEALTEAADQALYRAKAEGRNRVVLAGQA